MTKRQFVPIVLLLTAILSLAVSAVLSGNTQIGINIFMVAITIYFFLFLKNQITLNNKIESVLLTSGIAPMSLAMISLTAVISVHFFVNDTIQIANAITISGLGFFIGAFTEVKVFEGFKKYMARLYSKA